ncbi:MAG: hypothetical protein KatS3mg096_331 [Candidatus Parcubacteria bacterium]|nr:MAG: hypothetical protein KatS3mg096_331 [Candidatus Parcubacteria bacterium]
MKSMVKISPSMKNLILFLVAVLVGVVLGFAIISLTKGMKNYYAVFLNNGSIYFGKLSTFPRLKIDNALFIQVDQDGQASIQRFKDAAWMPKGQIYLNRNSILFIAPISENSPLINLIEGSQILPQQQQQPQQPQQPQLQSQQPFQQPSTATPQR